MSSFTCSFATTRFGRKKLDELTNGERFGIISFVILAVISINWINERMSPEAHLITLGVILAVFVTSLVYGAFTWISHLRKRG
jgi:hypothetical protein